MNWVPSFKLTASILAVALSLTIFLVAGCGDDSLSGSGNFFVEVLTSTPATELSRGTTATVEAIVVDVSGRPVAGQTVVFQVTPSSLGYFTPASVISEADGSAASVFTATAAGTATLEASVGGNSLTKVLRINDNAVSSGRVSIEVSPILMTANGVDSANIILSALSANNDPVPDGTVLFLTAGERFEDRNKDGYWTEGIDSLLFDANANGRWDPIGTIPSTVTTTNGTATATYRAGNQATTVYIRATLVEGTTAEFAEVSAKLNPNTTVASVTLSHNGEDLRVRGVGGIEWTIVTATAYDLFGNTVPEGIPIDFTIANGPGAGENIQGEGYGPVTVSTNGQGRASVTVYSGTASGTIRMRASSGSVISAVTHITVNAGPPAHLTVGVENCNLRAWDFVNVVNRISANVSDIWGNPVPDSTAVWFSTEEGFVIAQALTGQGKPHGIAEVDWYSGNPRNDGIVHIYAYTAGGLVGDTVAFISSGPAAYVTVLTYPSTLLADGESKGKVVVTVTDVNNNYVVAGTNVSFEADFGTVNGGGTQDGCFGSIFETEYTSEVLDRDYSPVSPDDGIGAVSVVSIRAGGFVGPGSYFTTLFLTSNTFTKNSSIDIDAEIEPGSTVPFLITVKDRSGNPLGGHLLQITASVGTLSSSQLVTDSYGEVNLFYTAPAAEGACIMTVTDLDPRGGVSWAQKIKIKRDDF